MAYWKNKIEPAMKTGIKEMLTFSLLGEFPNINLDKIANFWVKTISLLIKIVSGMTLLWIFIYAMPAYYKFADTKIIIILLVTIVLLLKSIDERLSPTE